MKTIRILIYTDYSNISQNKHSWGVTDLERFIRLKIKGVAKAEVSIKNRHFDYGTNEPRDGATRLTWELLSKYHELWVFGALQMNIEGHPYVELDKSEVKVLREWMKAGGLFITGDHANPVNNMTCQSDHKTFVNLGAALGRCIPRAGQLRVWDGPPTGCYDGPLEQRDNYNTQEGDDPANLDVTNLQVDDVPQTLRLPQGNPPHRLFWWYFDSESEQIIPINKFPDHIHEGKLKIPSELNGDWPAQSPLPLIVAQGRDKRFPNELRYYNSVIAYDGAPVDVGRIVADSSFHHYINRNLIHIPEREVNKDPKPGTCLDAIAQYYCNLALWLAPKKIRQGIIWGLLFEMSRHPDVLEEKGSAARILGRTAWQFLEFEVGISNLYRLLAPSEYDSDPEPLNDFLSFFFLGEKSRFSLPIVAEIALGYIVTGYHKFFEEQHIIDPGWLDDDPTTPEVAVRGLAQAFEAEGVNPEGHLLQFREAAEAFQSEQHESMEDSEG